MKMDQVNGVETRAEDEGIAFLTYVLLITIFDCDDAEPPLRAEAGRPARTRIDATFGDECPRWVR
jgi:hypothetical protein